MIESTEPRSAFPSAEADALEAAIAAGTLDSHPLVREVPQEERLECAKRRIRFLRMPIHCERCGEELSHDKAVWLDLNIYTHEYRKEPWPTEQSQGGFSFGVTCAKAVMNRGNQRIRKAKR